MGPPKVLEMDGVQLISTLHCTYVNNFNGDLGIESWQVDISRYLDDGRNYGAPHLPKKFRSCLLGGRALSEPAVTISTGGTANHAA